MKPRPGRAALLLGAGVTVAAFATAVGVRLLGGEVPPGAAFALSPVAARSDPFAAVQLAGAGSPEENMRELSRRVAEAAAGGARYVVVPEHVVRGPLDAARPERAAAVVEPPGGPTVRFFRTLAARHGVWIAFSVVEEEGGGSGYAVRTVLVDDRGRERGRVDKRVLRPNGADGDATVGFARVLMDTYDDGGRRIGILSGDDLQSGVPRLAIRGADAILVSANWDPDDPVRWEEVARQLAAEFNVHLVVANRYPALGGIFPAGGGSPRKGGAVGLARLPVAGAAWTVASSLGLPSVPIPAHQPFSPEVVELGRTLFLDEGLSSSGTVSCATCHDPERHFADGLPLGEGVEGRRTRRNVPSLLNAAFRTTLHWDGNPTTIEQQFKYPLVGFAELNLRSHEELVAYVRSRPAYVQAFREGMGLEPGEIGREEVAQALGAYQRTLVSGGSPFDRYRYGGERGALTPEAVRGLGLFTGEGRCSTCHTVGEEWSLFTDGRFHRLGIGYSRERRSYRDPGVGTVSNEDYAGMFFTPSLRNVAETAPYMHDGSVATLEEAVRVHFLHPERSPVLHGVRLTDAQVADLAAFLRSLTGRERYTARGERIPSTQTAAGARR